jgi:hypothetical protein
MTGREPWRTLPEQVVLHHTSSGWRFALYSAGGIVDGRVTVPNTASAEVARAGRSCLTRR